MTLGIKVKAKHPFGVMGEEDFFEPIWALLKVPMKEDN